MIKFFRNIRRRLLRENRFTRYLLYAIGEIILVVIGILIALQVSNWNEQTKRDRLELEALQNLYSDFDYNKEQLLQDIEDVKKNRKLFITILKHTGDRKDNDINMDTLLYSAASTPQFYPQNGFLMDLINSGKLGLIKDDELRYQLSSWLPSIETLKEREQLSIDFEKDIVTFINENGSWLDADKLSKSTLIRSLDLPDSGFKIDNNLLLEKLEFENMIESNLVHQAGLLSRMEVCLEINKSILRLIEDEIKRGND